MEKCNLHTSSVKNDSRRFVWIKNVVSRINKKFNDIYFWNLPNEEISKIWSDNYRDDILSLLKSNSPESIPLAISYSKELIERREFRDAFLLCIELAKQWVPGYLEKSNDCAQGQINKWKSIWVSFMYKEILKFQIPESVDYVLNWLKLLYLKWENFYREEIEIYKELTFYWCLDSIDNVRILWKDYLIDRRKYLWE